MTNKTVVELGVESIEEESLIYNLANQLRPWLVSTRLGEDCLLPILNEYGRLNVCLPPDDTGIPHPVHFREGVVIRNRLRELTGYSWTDERYDNLWEDITIHALRMNQ